MSVPLAPLALSFALSFAVSLAVENGWPSTRSFRAPAAALALRLGLHLALFSAAFALSWRPWHAGLVVVVASGLFGAGDAIKRRILGEPLVFTDFALVRLAIRHPRLYYAERLARPRALLTMAAVVAATVGWFAVEPSILPDGGWGLLAVPPLVALLVALGFRLAVASEVAQSAIGASPDAERDTGRLGLGAGMLLGWLVWRRQQRPTAAALSVALASPAPRRAAVGPKIVVAIQCESFVEITTRGLPGPDLPNYRELAQEGLAWGRCRVPADGAYTMRSEFGFLTGLPTGTLGFDAYDPFLQAPAYARFSMANRFLDSGRRTVLIHPYDKRFFDRDRIAPLFGFERFVDGAAFDTAARFGPHVSDEALGDVLIAEIEGAAEPAFLFAVTIENHGPWGPGRISGVDDPAEQYALHLANTDLLIGRVMTSLATSEDGGVLCVYGDHAPARALHPALADRGSTDYAVWDSRRPRAAPSPRRDLSIDAVGRLVLASS